MPINSQGRKTNYIKPTENTPGPYGRRRTHEDSGVATEFRFIRNRVVRYVAAVIAVLMAGVIRQFMASRYGAFPPYLTFFPAIFFVALSADARAALLATALSAAAADYLAIKPFHSFSIEKSDDAMGMAVFCLTGIAISLVTEFHHRKREELAANQTEAAIRNETRELEEARKLAEAVASERKLLFDVLDTLPTMVSLLTPGHKVVFANRSAKEQFGESNDKPCFEVRFGRQSPCESCETFTPLITGKPHRWEVPCGHEHIFDAYDLPFKDVDGSNLILEMKIDITAQKKAERELKNYRQTLEALVAERTQQLQTANDRLIADIAVRERTEAALQRSNQRLELAMQVADFGEWSVNLADRSGSHSARHAQIFGYPSPLPTWSFDRFIEHVLPGHRERVKQTVSDCSCGSTFDIETQIHRVDGEIRWIWVRGRAGHNDVDHRNMFGTVMDITERKCAEEELVKSEARFRALFESSLDAVLYTFPDGTVLAANPAACAMFGMTEQMICSKGRLGLLAGDESRHVMIAEERQRKGQLVKKELIFLRNDGEKFTGEVDSVILPGEIEQRFVIIRDITNRKRAEAALLNSEKLAAVGRMAASIAHEINNPLEAVTNTLFLARLNAEEPASVRKFLDLADDELKRIAHITRQTLGFYREIATPTDVSVIDVLDAATDLLQGKIRKVRGRIEKRYDEDFHVSAIPGELRQVFANLLGNSLDAIDHGGVIQLRISRVRPVDGHPPRVRITVADNGHGIKPAARARIFEPLFTTKGSTGTGLGLWVAKQIVDKYQGSIYMRSCTAGARRGTLFAVLLPVAQPCLPNPPA